MSEQRIVQRPGYRQIYMSDVHVPPNVPREQTLFQKRHKRSRADQDILRTCDCVTRMAIVDEAADMDRNPMD